MRMGVVIIGCHFSIMKQLWYWILPSLQIIDKVQIQTTTQRTRLKKRRMCVHLNYLLGKLVIGELRPVVTMQFLRNAMAALLHPCNNVSRLQTGQTTHLRKPRVVIDQNRVMAVSELKQIRCHSFPRPFRK